MKQNSDEYKDDAYEDNFDDAIDDDSPAKNDYEGDSPDDANMVGDGRIQNHLVDKEVE